MHTGSLKSYSDRWVTNKERAKNGVMPEQTIRITWKIYSVLRSAPPLDKQSLVFNISPNTSLYSQFGIPLEICYIPRILQPTVTYHQVIRDWLKKNQVIVKEKNFPYYIEIPDLGSVSLNLRIRVFPPNIASMTLSLTNISAAFDATRLIELQGLIRRWPLHDIVRRTLAMIETLSHRGPELSRDYKATPAIHVADFYDRTQFKRMVKERKNEIVSVLIRQPHYEEIDDTIPTDILEKNRQLNVKDTGVLLLLNKQGVLFLTPTETSSTYRAQQRTHLNKIEDLIEFALVFGTFLSNYRQLRTQEEDWADFLLSKIQPWISDPSAVFCNSVSYFKAWELISREFGLQARKDLWTKNPGIRLAIEEKSRFFDQVDSQWWKEDDFVSVLATRMQESKGVTLNFLGNADLKLLISSDRQEAEKSLRSKNYKATILLCGSLAEALLTAVLDRGVSGWPSRKELYEEYNLNKLIELSVKKKIITDRSLRQLLDSIRNYRNMIHPGVQMRQSLVPDEHKATIAVETLNLLIKELANFRVT